MKEIFVNMSNHPSSRWSQEQKAAAENYYDHDFYDGTEIRDTAFPQIPAKASHEYVKNLAIGKADEIEAMGASKVMLQGETSFCFCLNKELKERGILTVAALSEPNMVQNADGSVTKTFEFKGFREINSFEPEKLEMSGEKADGLVNVGFASARWSDKQKEAAKTYGDVTDIKFPYVPTQATPENIAKMAHETAAEIAGHNPEAVICSGEAALTYAITSELEANGIQVIAACSERNTIELSDGSKKVNFEFEQFREVNEPDIERGLGDMDAADSAEDYDR